MPGVPVPPFEKDMLAAIIEADRAFLDEDTEIPSGTKDVFRDILDFLAILVWGSREIIRENKP